MKLDPTVMRSMDAQDFRVLEAVEKGMKNHSIVPLALINSLANLRHGGTHKIISSLLRDKLLSHERKKNAYDGYRLTNAGYDILALQNLKARGFVAALGQRIGTGKESDVYLGADSLGQQVVLKFHRLGRTSFRNVKQKRDYFGRATQQSHSWLFLSRLSSLKEFAFMKALFDVGYPTPTPIAHNRHILAMSLVRGLPLYQIFPKQISVVQAADIYEQAIGVAVRLAKHGLVHCDLNEFNLLVDLSGIQALATDAEDPYVRHSGQSVAGEKSLGALSKPAWEQSLEENDNVLEALPKLITLLENGEPKPVVTLIDFPQMISIKHPNARELYERDIACLRRFFELKLSMKIPDDIGIDSSWENIISAEQSEETFLAEERLDQELKASGFSDNVGRDLELYYYNNNTNAIANVASVEGIAEEDVEDESDDDQSNEAEDRLEQPTIDYVKDQVNFEDVAADGVQFDAESDTEPDVAEFDFAGSELGSVTITREKLMQQAKQRVKRHLEDEKRKHKKKGAFRKKNSNKNYVKGKRVLTDSGL